MQWNIIQILLKKFGIFIEINTINFFKGAD